MLNQRYDGVKKFLPVPDDLLKVLWVRVRPAGGYSSFNIEFFDETPKRMFMPKQTENSLEERKS